MSSKPLLVDMSSAETPEELHTILAESLGFPDYYGKNWDAFWDIVRDPEGHLVDLPEKVYFTGWNEISSRLSREARLFEKCVVDLADYRYIRWRFLLYRRGVDELSEK